MCKCQSTKWYISSIIMLLLPVLLFISLSGCSAVHITGLENYGAADCSYELSRDLFPDETFLSSFDYCDGDYVLECKDGLGGGQATAFAYITYSQETYEDAKQYCLDHLVLCSDHRFSYNGFEFRERLSHLVKNDAGEFAVGCRYPEWFNMFGYCDASYTLVFMGYYNPDHAETDFASFVESVYSQYYDFNQS